MTLRASVCMMDGSDGRARGSWFVRWRTLYSAEELPNRSIEMPAIASGLGLNGFEAGTEYRVPAPAPAPAQPLSSTTY